MNYKRKTILLWVIGLFSLVQFSINAQNEDLTKKLPLDPKVKTGVLENGIKYYIRENNKPENKVELRLVLNAGSMQENEDQLGLAHFTEHMCFNGTKNFEKNELVSYLQSVGVKFGAHLNAYTSFDETVYMLSLPADKPDVLDKGLLILEDWAHNVSFDHDEIDKERGVVIEEWRLGQGAQQRMMDKTLPVLFKDSRYAQRLPIGKKDILENFKYQTIKDFYNTWYRPDLMAVVAVGAIKKEEIEKKIKEYFSRIPKADIPKARESYDVPGHKETLVTIARDKEATYTSATIYYKMVPKPFETYQDYKSMLSNQLYNGMLNLRLRELQQQATPPFIIAQSVYTSMVRAVNAYLSTVVVSETGLEKGIKTVLEENEKVKRFGFTANELDRYKKEMLAFYEQAYNERGKTTSGNYASEYVNLFLDGSPSPGIEFEYEFVKNNLSSITLDEINQLAKKWITKENRVVVLNAPEKESIKMLNEKEIIDLLDAAEKADIKAYTEDLKVTSLMETTPKAATIVSEKLNEDFGVTELVLENGVKVVLKPTDFKNDEIRITGFSDGGYSVYEDNDFLSAYHANTIIQKSGVSEFSLINLQKLLAGKQVDVSSYISSLEQGIYGNSSKKDVETMFKLLNLKLTKPRVSKEAFDSYINTSKDLYKNLLSNPQYYYQNELIKTITQDHVRGGGFPDESDWDKIDMNRAFEMYKERFVNIDNFTFVIVGSFDLATIKPLIASYIGSIPKTGKKEEWKDRGIRPPSKKTEVNVKKGADPKSLVAIYFKNEFKFKSKEVYKLKSLADVLTIKLTETLREEKSGVYGVSASSSASRLPYENYSFSISFPCAPENVASLTKAAFDEIKKIKENGVSEKDLKKIKETQINELKENRKKNGYWLNYLKNSHKYNSKLKTLEESQGLIEGLSSKDLQKIAQKYIDLENYIKVVLLPENG